ncbi:MAG: hypothetical protein AAGA72_13980 [Pseudomonadota bacterium]
MRLSTSSVLKSIVHGTLELPDGRLRQAVLRELFDQLASVMKPLALITAINGTVVTLIFAQFTEWWLALIWLGPILYFSYYQYVGAKAMAAVPKDAKLSGGFLKKGARNNFLFGAWWASSCLIFVGPDPAANITLAALSMGMCAAAAACLGSNAAMAARFLAGAVPVTVFSLFFIDGAAAVITSAMGGTLAVTMVYMAHLKYNDTVEMLRVRLGLELSKARLESAVRTLGIGLEITDNSGEVVFSNANMATNREAIALGGRTREGFSFWHGKYYRQTEFNGVEGDKIELVEDVSSLVESQQAILQSRQQAEQALQTKSAFFESISREVIYPIKTIMKYARLLQPDSRIRFDDEELGNLADLIMNASKDLEQLMSSMTRHSLDENAHMVDAEMVKLREIFRDELIEMARADLDELTLHQIVQAVPEDLLVKSSASGSLTRALGQMCLKAHRTVGADGALSLYVRAMPDESDAICFIVRGVYGALGPRPYDKMVIDSPDETDDEITLDAYATYMSATHIENLGGQYRENLGGEKSVNLVAVVPSDHVQSGAQALKTLPLKSAAH